MRISRRPVDQSLALLGVELAEDGVGRQARVVERVVGVAAADAGDRPLVPKDRVDPAAVGALAEERRGLVRERLRAEGGERTLVAGRERPHARLPLLPELLDQERRPLGEPEPRHRAPRLRRLRRRLDVEPASLREMHEHPIAAFEVEDQVLPPPADAPRAAPHELGGPRRHGLQRGELQEVEALERRSADGVVQRARRAPGPRASRACAAPASPARYGATSAPRMISIASSIRSRCVRWLTMHARMMWRPSIVVLERYTRFGLVDPREERPVLVVGRPREPERHHGELRRPRQLDLGDLGERRVQVLREVELLVERLPERAHAVEHERQPHAEASMVPRQLRRVLVPVGQLRLRRPVLEVLGADVVRVAERGTVADDEGARAVGQEHPLVRVERDRVGALDPAEALPAAIGEMEEAAVGGVDVHPEVLGLGDVGHRVHRIDRARVGGPRGGDDEERPPAGGPILGDHRLQRLGVHPELRVDGDEPHRAARHARRSPPPSAPRRGPARSRSRSRRAKSSPSFTWRAVTTADRFAIEPPVVRMPRASSG